jgi:hypothetical protein
MPPAFGVGEHRIGFHDVLEGRRALGTDAVGMIEFGQFAVGMQNISGGRRPWDAENKVVVFQCHTGLSWMVPLRRAVGPQAVTARERRRVST